jgi:hypothetical protein
VLLNDLASLIKDLTGWLKFVGEWLIIGARLPKELQAF